MPPLNPSLGTQPLPATLDCEEALAAWSRCDLACAVLPADRELVAASTTVRALVVDLLVQAGPCDELYDACAVLGRLFAQRGGSPTLASATIDHVAEALASPGAAWVPSARAALWEGFASALLESAQQAAMLAWEYPACSVPLGEGALAVAAGHPSDDDEVLAAWSARIARGATLRGVRRAIVSGGDRASEALLDAFQVVGIDARRC
jgi:hypothetical protein